MSFFINDALAQGAEGQQAGTLELILPLLLQITHRDKPAASQ